jgi:hypothetical protein
MEILRVPPYPITTTWTLPDADYDYIVYVEDLVDHSIETSTITSDENGIVTYVLPASKIQFDRQFLIRFYDAEYEHIIYESNLDIVRPYVNPSSLATTATDIANYKKNELIARSIIDTYTGIGFYNHKSILQVVGNGLDYMPVWRDANRVLKVYENNAMIFNGEDVAIPITSFETTGTDTVVETESAHGYLIGDSITLAGFTDTGYNSTFSVQEVMSTTEFRITTLAEPTLNGAETAKRVWAYNFKVTLDNSAIVKEFTGYSNIITTSYPKLPIARGDYAYDDRTYGTFVNNADYLFVLDEGFRAIPADVERATIMLIDDLMCGRLDYYQKYVTNYNTDQYRIQFDKKMLEGTGNLIVDKILDKYMKSITKVGVL